MQKKLLPNGEIPRFRLDFVLIAAWRPWRLGGSISELGNTQLPHYLILPTLIMTRLGDLRRIQHRKVRLCTPTFQIIPPQVLDRSRS